MRFIENGPILPDELLNAQDEGRVVFFCGAGVSMADAQLPSFTKLASDVLKQLGETEDGLAKKLFLASQEIEKKYNLRGFFSADQIFGKLARSFNSKEIDRAVAECLKSSPKADLYAHKSILKLARLSEGQTRLITTNFDLLFEKASGGKIKSKTRSDLPRIEYCDNDWGIIHLHGKVNADYSGSDKDGFVLSSAEFGDAYLAQGWARDFVRDVLDRYVAVFIGYSADDPPMRYLLEGLQQSKGFKNKLYAFQSETDEEAVAQWDDKGVEPILYKVGPGYDYSALWNTLDLWAKRSNDPVAWKKKILRKAKRGPAKLPPHERGMIAHLVKSQMGAKACALEDPPLPAEWLCVFDDRIRLKGYEKDDIFSPNPKIVSLYQRYSLDDDPLPSEEETANTNYRQAPIEVWNAFKFDKSEQGSIEEKSLPSLRGYHSVSPPDLTDRLGYIASWIGKVAHQRIAVWWAGQQKGLHPALLGNINFKILNDETKPAFKETAAYWNMIFELNKFSDRGRHEEYSLKSRVNSVGWSNIIVREYLSICSPYLTQGVLYESIPLNKKKLSPRSLIRVDVKYPEKSFLKNFKVPEEYLSEVVRGFRSNLEKAVDMELDYAGWIDVCSIEPDDEDEQEHIRGYDLSGYVLHFVSLYKKLMKANIEQARQEYRAWRRDAVFTRLRIWACGQKNITNETEFIEEILSIGIKDFWSFKGERDLLLCLRSNWKRLSKKNISLIEKKIIRGPEKTRRSSQIEHEVYSAHKVLNRLHWLKNEDCDLTFDLEKLTKELSIKAPDWNPQYAQYAAESHDGKAGWVRTDTNWTSLENIPASEIIDIAQKNGGRNHRDFVEYAPFSGLCDDLPLKALSALVFKLKSGSFPEGYWEIFLSRDKRKEDSLRLKTVIAGRLVQISDEHFKKLLLTASRWFESAGPLLRDENPGIFQRLWDKFIQVITLNASFSGSALVRQEQKDVDWTSEAINSPSGNMAELHMTDRKKEGLKVGKGYPKDWLKRVEELLSLPDDAHRYAMVIFCFNLNWFYNIDPKWTSSNILRIVEDTTADEQDKEAIWAGFMWGARVPSAELYVRLKPFFIEMAAEKFLDRKRYTEILSGVILSGWGSKDKKRKRFISSGEFRSVLLNATEEFRMQTLWHLERWSSDKKLRWHKQVINFIENVWPKHKKVMTAKASARLCDIAFTQDENFPAVSKLIVQRVSKITNEHFFLPEMKKSGSSIAEKYPLDLLALLHAVLPERAEIWPYGTRDVLKALELSDPSLLNNPMLIDLKSRLGGT